MGKRLGIWIPVGIMEIKNLDWGDKILLTEILSLHQTKHGCIASNQYFGSILGMTSGAASKRISRLIKSGFIKTKNIYRNGGCVGRVITPEKSLNETYLSKNEISVGENTPEIVYKTSSEGGMVDYIDSMGKVEPPLSTSHTTSTVLLQQQGGTSLTIPEVVLNRPRGSSAENTINTSITILEKLDKNEQEQLKQPLAHNTGQNSENIEEEPDEEYSWDSLAGARKIMNAMLYDYPYWEGDMLNMGLDNFIQKIERKYPDEPIIIEALRDFWKM